MGAIQEQNFGYGLQPVAFASGKLNKAEICYSIYERIIRHDIGPEPVETLFSESPLSSS